MAATIAPYRPSPTACVGVRRIPVSPAEVRPAAYSLNVSAPATQPAKLPRSARSVGVRSSSATMSLTPRRPPGRSTRAISEKTRGFSVERLMTQLLIAMSTEASGSGIASISPLTKTALSTPACAALRRASVSISSVMSSPYAVPPGPTRRAARRTSIPPPDPRSRTVSPGRRSATAVGLPQPRLAATASTGSGPSSSGE